MDIPRGTFSAIRRDSALSAVLAEIRETSFSGHAMVSHGSGLFSLVFSEGTCILAEYQDLLGAAAWQAVRSLGEEKVQVELHLLTTQQLRLADEFNKNARVAAAPHEPRAREERAHERQSVRKAPQETERLVVPRGEFCEIKKGVTTAGVLESLKARAFSGYGLFTTDSIECTLVFSGGSCILAGYGNDRGAAALAEAKASDAPADVGLYALTPQQVALALEFNAGYRVESAHKTGAPRTTVKEEPSPLRKRTSTAPAAPARKTPKSTDSPPSSTTDAVMKDLEALDAINPAEMAANLKSGYISILDRLQLGHLVDEKKKKEV